MTNVNRCVPLVLLDVAVQIAACQWADVVHGSEAVQHCHESYYSTVQFSSLLGAIEI